MLLMLCDPLGHYLVTVSYLFYPILCACDVSDNPEGYVKYFLDILWVLMCYNLPANLFIL